MIFKVFKKFIERSFTHDKGLCYKTYQAIMFYSNFDELFVKKYKNVMNFRIIFIYILINNSIKYGEVY
jgi:hypothetical protein